MKTNVAISFWPHKCREFYGGTLGPDVRVVIYCRVTVRGRKAEISTNLRTTYGNWLSDGEHGRAKGKTPHDKHINSEITRLRDQVNAIHADLERQGRPVTAQAIARIYRLDGAVLDMNALYAAFLTERATLVGIEIAPASYEVSKTRQGILSDFLQAHHLTDLRPEEFTHNMADKLLYWLLRERGYKRSYGNKVLQTMSQCLRWGVRREHLEKNPMDLYQFKAAAAAEIKYLSVGELARLTSFDLPTATLDRTRDCFIFQCWTGLAYADLAALDLETDAHYHRDAHTNTLRRVLHITRQKSTMQHGYECVIPLLPEAERILAKYNDSLPVASNQRYNRALKEVGELCGFAADKMKSHVGRKTAGVMMLNMGIRIETVSKFLGHSSIRMTEKVYAKMLDTTVVDDFNRLFAGSQPFAEPPATVFALPVPKEPAPALRPARRLAPAAVELSPAAPEVTDGRWRRPPPVTSHGPRL